MSGGDEGATRDEGPIVEKVFQSRLPPSLRSPAKLPRMLVTTGHSGHKTIENHIEMKLM